MIPWPDKTEFRLVIGAMFRWKPYFGKYTTFKGFEFSWLGVYFQAVIS